MARILLVDDEDCILRTVAMFLDSEGHSSVCAANGREAETMLKSSEFDLLMTDIRMEPMDGMQLIKVVRAMKPNMPIVVVSAYGSEKTAREAMALGACRYIKKPFKFDEIVRAVREVTAGSKQPRA